MDLILCWFIAPIGLLAAAVGLSFWVERLTGLALPWAVRPAMGMAAMIVIAQFGTATEATAKLTLPAILVAALIGLILFRRMATPRPGTAEVWVAVTVFFLLSLPFLVAGEATWAGYIKLDDNATWLAITEHVFEHGRGLGHPEPSTNQQVLEDYLGGAYPIGGFVPMAVMSKISGQDVAFTIQPSMAAAAAMLALLLLDLARRIVRSVGASALIAIAASLSALFLGYYLWGGVKELVTAALLPLGPLLAGQAAREDWPRRAWATLSLTVAAIIVVLGPGGGLWAIPILIPALVLAWRRYGSRGALRLAIPVAVLAVILVLPVIFTPTGPFDPLNGGITGEAEIGNLYRPLSVLQAAGIWPSLDFRVDPHLNTLVRIISALCIALAAAAIAMALRWKRGEGIPLAGYVGGGAVGAAVIIAYASTWVDAKVLATLSPGVLFAAMLALVSSRSGRTSASRPGPRSSSSSVSSSGVPSSPTRGPGLRPARTTRSWRRSAKTLTAKVLRWSPRYPVMGRATSSPTSMPRAPATVVVVRFSCGTENRRPTPFRSTSTKFAPISSTPTTFWSFAVAPRPADRPPNSGSPTAATTTKSGGEPSSRERWSKACPWEQSSTPDRSRAALRSPPWRARPEPSGSLVAARVGTPIAVEFDAAELPEGWTTPSAYTFSPSGSGTATVEISVPGGEYEVWLGGEVFGAVNLSIDGEKIASERGVLNNNGGLEQLATVPISAGDHELEVEYSGASLYPGSAVHPYAIGPLEFGPHRGVTWG